MCANTGAGRRVTECGSRLHKDGRPGRYPAEAAKSLVALRRSRGCACRHCLPSRPSRLQFRHLFEGDQNILSEYNNQQFKRSTNWQQSPLSSVSNGYSVHAFSEQSQLQSPQRYVIVRGQDFIIWYTCNARRLLARRSRSISRPCRRTLVEVCLLATDSDP